MKQILTILTFTFFLVNNLYATHIAGGDITYTCLGGNQYQINLNLFVDCADGLEPGDQENIDFTSTCGQSLSLLVDLLNPGGTEVSQLCPTSINSSTCNGGFLPGMKVFHYSGVVTLTQPCDTWTMSWNVCCRNAAVLNLQSPDSFGSYIEANLNSLTSLCNNSPTFTSQPIPYVCANQPVSYDYGMIETDGDSLHFTLINAMDAGAVDLVYNAGFTPINPIQGITIDPLTGLLTFTPNTLGNFVVVVQVEEFDNNGNLIGTVMRDIQFIVENCTNNVPDAAAGSISNFSGTAVQTGPYSLDMCEGSNFTFDAIYTDVNAGDVLSILSNIATVLPGSTVITSGTNPLTATISWTATAGSSNTNTSFSVTVNDGACPVLGIQTFAYDINVLSRTLTNADQTICGTQAVNLVATAGSVFTWNVLSGPPIIIGTNFSCNPCANPIANPIATTTYEVVSDLIGSCVNRDTVTITVAPDFTFTTTQTIDPSVCSRQLVQLEVTPAPVDLYTYSWSPSIFLDNNSISNPLANITTPGTYKYFVDITSPLGCSKKDSVTLTVIPIPNLILAGDTTICLGESVMLNALSNVLVSDDFDGATVNNALWSNVNGAVLSTDCGSVSGNALHFDANLRVAETVAFNTLAGGQINFSIIIGTGGFPCEDADIGEDVFLEYSIDGGVNWINMGTFLTTSFATFTNVTIQIPAGAMSASTLFRWNQSNFSGSGTDNWALDDVSIDITSNLANANYTYEWFEGATSIGTLDSILVTPSQTTTTYKFVMTDILLGCQIIDSITISAGAVFTLTTTNDTTLCSIAGISLLTTASVVDNYSYSWSPITNLANPTDSLTTANPDATIKYFVTATSSLGCTITDSVLVTVAQRVNLNLVGDTTICIGETVDINALFSNSISDDFNGASVNGSIWSNVNGAVLSTDCGSVSGNALHFDANSIRIAETVPFNTLAGGQISFSIIIGSGGFPCENADNGEDIDLEYSIDGGINWISMGTFLTTSFATFTNLTIPIPAGAMSSSTLFRWNQANFSGSGSDNWALDDVTIDVTSNVSNYSFEWFEGSNSISIIDSIIVSPIIPTQYNFIMTDALTNCKVMDSITVHTGPVFTLNTTNDITLCSASSVNIQTTASAPDTYTFAWTPSATVVSPTNSSTVANPISTTRYVVNVTSSLGCEIKDSVLVTILPAINISISGDNAICNGESSVLTASGATTYTWNNSSALNTTSGNIVSVDPQTTETFTVLGTVGLCVDSTTFTVTVNQAPLATLTSSNPLNCLNSSTTLSASSTGNVVVWNGNGLVNAPSPVTVSDAGIYNATVTNPLTTCSAVYPITVILEDSVIANFSLNPNIGTMPLVVDFTNTSQNASTYLWDFGNGQTSNDINPSSTYLTSGVDTITLIAFNSLGCPDSMKLVVTVLEPKLTCEKVQLIIPNIITVNDDNINELLEISYNKSDVFSFSCIILNRWGEKVAEINDITKSWDGNDLRGNPCNAGVYFYKINLTCELDEKQLDGFIHLIR